MHDKRLPTKLVEKMGREQYKANKFCKVVNFHTLGSTDDEAFRILLAVQTSAGVSRVNTRLAIKYCDTK